MYPVAEDDLSIKHRGGCSISMLSTRGYIRGLQLSTVPFWIRMSPATTKNAQLDFRGLANITGEPAIVGIYTLIKWM